MAVLHISDDDDGLRLHGAPRDMRATLAHALRRSDGPVTVLVHGYKYAPGHAAHCPHRTLFSLAPQSRNPRVISWPRHLRAERGGLTLAFAWQGRGTLWDAYARAARAGQALAALCETVAALAPARKVHVMAHSLGARVALSALPRLKPGRIDTLLLLAAAEYRSVADAALTSPAGRAAQMLHVTSGENALYDTLFEQLIKAPERGDRALGRRAETTARQRRLMLDHAPTLDALAEIGFRIGPPARRICHWSPYLRPGVFPLYRALIAGALPMARLDAALALAHRADVIEAPLPFAANAAV